MGRKKVCGNRDRKLAEAADREKNKVEDKKRMETEEALPPVVKRPRLQEEKVNSRPPSRQTNIGDLSSFLMQVPTTQPTNFEQPKREEPPLPLSKNKQPAKKISQPNPEANYDKIFENI